MPGSPHPEPDIAARRLVLRAQALARQAGRPVLARLARPAGPVPFAAALRAGLRAGAPVFAAVDLASGAAVFARGAVPGFGGPVADAAAAAALQASAAAALVSEAEPEAPLSVFSLPFQAPASPPPTGGPWAGARPGALWVPEALWFRPRSGAGWWRIRQVAVAHGADPGPLRAALAGADGPPVVAGRCRPAVGPAPTPLEPEAAWRARVRAAARACAAGALEKVVLARAVRYAPADGARFDGPGTFEALLRREPGTTVFAFSAGPEGLFLGASPELLAAVEGRRISTVALAGTAPRTRDEAQDVAAAAALQASRKDGREHAAVVAGIRAALGPVCPLIGGDTRPHVRRLASVMHLETRLEGRLRAGVGLLEVLDRLHPTPALGGAPRAAAAGWLAATEPLDRGAYGAPFGWVTPAGGGAAWVAIRAALVRPEAAVAFAGAGVVAGSDPAREWAETQLKLQPVRAALQHEAPR